MKRIWIAGLALVALAFGGLATAAHATQFSQSAESEDCGEVTLSGTAGKLDGDYILHWFVESHPGISGNIALDGEETITFAEDLNGGAISVVYFSTSPESDENLPPEEIAVVTDCEEPVPEPTPTEVPEMGSITVVKDANGAGSLDFDFTFNGANFNLSNDEFVVFDDLDAGSYIIDEVGADGWALDDIDCSGADTTDNDTEDGDVRVHLGAGEHATCVFTNLEAPAAPTATTAPQATATLVPVPTPIIVEVEVPGPTRIVERETFIRPPSTGSAGLAQ